VPALDVYITRTSSLLPNKPVTNDTIENVLGIVGNKPSRTKKLILRQNGITERYYVLDPKTRQPNYSNAQLTAEAVRALFNDKNDLSRIDCLASGTTLPDQLAPNHGLMVHGELEIPPCEVVATSGICLSGITALKYAYLAVKCGEHQTAVSTGSETASVMLRAEKFVTSHKSSCEDIKKHPELCFEKDFLRWLLSDGAGAFLLEPQFNGHHPQTVVKIDWLKIYSFANQLETCMYAGATKEQNGKLTSWTNYSYDCLVKDSLMTIQQDVRLLNENIIKVGIQALGRVREETGLKPEQIDYFLPHLSSMYFFNRAEQAMDEVGFSIPREKWFSNLATKGNTGSASIYIMLDELLKSGRCVTGEKILCMIPESGRFSCAYMLLTVV
jgi:3-oxoacyl-[acyl-carrier-protein] synthase-3